MRILHAKRLWCLTAPNLKSPTGVFNLKFSTTELKLKTPTASKNKIFLRSSTGSEKCFWQKRMVWRGSRVATK